VRKAGLEPASLAALAPKASVFAISPLPRGDPGDISSWLSLEASDTCWQWRFRHQRLISAFAPGPLADRVQRINPEAEVPSHATRYDRYHRRFLSMPVPPPLAWLLVGLSLSPALMAQDPSQNLREADADYRQGVAALNQNDLDAAQAKFEAVTRLVPSAEQGHSALGAVLVRKGEWARGTRELEKALAIKPNDSAAQMNLAMVYAQTGTYVKAISLFSKLESEARADHHPLSISALEAYARCLQANGQTRAAIVQMKQAVTLESRSAELRDELGSLYATAKDWVAAEEQFSEAVSLKDDLAVAHLHLGIVLSAEQKPGAEAEWKKAYSLAPNEPEIALAAGKALSDAGRDEEAVPILEHAVAIDPKSTAARYELALVLQRTNRVTEAVALLEKVVEAQPRNGQALTNLGTALAQMHEAEKGIPFLKRAVAIDPGNATAHQDLAAAYIQVNQVVDATEELKTAIRIAPDSPQLHYDLGASYKLQDDAADAIPELEKAEQLNPSGYEPAYALGLLYMQAARYKEAAQQLETSLRLNPENGEGWETLGSVYSKLERLPEAASALREAIRRMPDQADSHLILASVLVKQNDTAGAAQERKVAANLMREHMNLQRAEVATNAGKALLKDGKLDDAIVQFRDALAFDPSYADAHLELAAALEKQGKRLDAAAERARGEALMKQAQ
jgi:protein O-GlcNAc transferase